MKRHLNETIHLISYLYLPLFLFGTVNEFEDVQKLFKIRITILFNHGTQLASFNTHRFVKINFEIQTFPNSKMLRPFLSVLMKIDFADSTSYFLPLNLYVSKLTTQYSYKIHCDFCISFPRRRRWDCLGFQFESWWIFRPMNRLTWKNEGSSTKRYSNIEDWGRDFIISFPIL